MAYGEWILIAIWILLLLEAMLLKLTTGHIIISRADTSVNMVVSDKNRVHFLYNYQVGFLTDAIKFQAASNTPRSCQPFGGRILQRQQTTDNQLQNVGQRGQVMEQHQQQMMSFLAKAMHSPGFTAQFSQQQTESNRHVTGGDIQACKATRKSVDSSLKEITKELKSPVAFLQSSPQATPILPKVEEVIAKERDLQEKLMAKHSTVVDCYEKEISQV
ncbi:hypothetical protein KIW84_013825 [Lathyrus oleraceus]|uniref:Uncharacterized protein n=1 Tax=Pisum sativum TaxID=3888 RepID=A0A9D5BL42_PEA|nr:hypothetical protein KIW84_013825 [Pisum sativum]